jgi:hypothetical protein
MTRVAVLIPCHIHYEGQIDLLDKCIKSLLEQTKLPESIYISVSFYNEIYKKDFVNNILQKYGKITMPKITFKFSKEQKYQMEHLHNISSNIDNNYDMFMFCDDDDTYHIQRIEKFVKGFEYGKDNNVEKFGGIREYFKSDNDPSLETPEYWAYGIVPNAITDFFTFFNGEHYKLLQHKFGDMYFRHYLRKNKKYLKWIQLVDDGTYRLYKYNINNPNSICGKIEQGIGNIYDNVLLKILDCRTDSNFNNIINKISEKKMKVIFKYIYEFCKSLYK